MQGMHGGQLAVSFPAHKSAVDDRSAATVGDNIPILPRTEVMSRKRDVRQEHRFWLKDPQACSGRVPRPALQMLSSGVTQGARLCFGSALVMGLGPHTFHRRLSGA